MTRAELVTLYDYSYWANDRLFTAIAPMSADEFTREVAGSYGSVRSTLVHMMSAESGWLDRCGGPPRGDRLNPLDFPTLESVASRWALYEDRMRPFLAALSDLDLERRITYSIPTGFSASGRIGELLHHAVLHNLHHRGQAALLVRALGYVPGNFDILFYYSEKEAPV